MKKAQKPDYEFSATSIAEEIQVEELEQVALIEEAPIEKSIEKIPIYVCGEVVNPNVYYLYETDIIQQAIRAAGGFTVDANQDVWNLAMEIQKGMKIDVPKIGEQIDKMHNSYDNSISDIDILNGTHSLVNINQANVQELTTLTGIGSVTAQNIITYRDTNGEFESLEDVKNVPRIGEVTFEKIKDHICLQ